MFSEILRSIVSVLAVAASYRMLIEWYYEDLLDCKLIQREGHPMTYNCDHLNDLDKDKCYYKGKQYSLGEIIKDGIGDPCISECTCQMEYNNTASFNCSLVECPQLLHNLTDGCVNIYEKGKCCPVRTHCEDKNGPLPVCTYEGKTYKYGQKIYPSQDSCTTCICQEGFNGTLTEPFCEKRKCEMYLNSQYFPWVRKGCVPNNYKRLANECCPTLIWRCPSDSDAVVESDPINFNDQDPVCKFGKLELKMGQKLSETEKCVECSCVVPPHVFCAIDPAC